MAVPEILSTATCFPLLIALLFPSLNSLPHLIQCSLCVSPWDINLHFIRSTVYLLIQSDRGDKHLHNYVYSVSFSYFLNTSSCNAVVAA